MIEDKNTQVLVVGAGPVGMLSALLLAEQGANATVIDSARGTAAHSYACAMHPRSLELLDRFGLVGEILEWCHCVSRIAFYDGPARRAEVNLSEIDSKFPFLAILPQNALEWLLERTLNRRAKIKIHWRHRLSGLQSVATGSVAKVDDWGAAPSPAPGTGPIEASPPTTHIGARFVVGADGYHSTVRRALGIQSEHLGAPEFFSLFEFDTDVDLDQEVRVVLDDSTTNVLWPISHRRCRWSFQGARLALLEQRFPEKGRDPTEPNDPDANRQIERRLARLIEERAPWFKGKVAKLRWATQVQFERCLAKQLTNGRCWLVGDAAHQTSPIGVQSLNVGLWEADELAASIKSNLLKDAPDTDSEAWNQRWRAEWLKLLGSGALSVQPGTGDWIGRRAARIVQCLPASGVHLESLLAQIGINLG